MSTASQLHCLCNAFICKSSYAFPSFWPFLTSTVHKFPDVSGGHDLVGAQIVSDLATNGHDNGHDKVRKCRNYAHLAREKIYILCNRFKTSKDSLWSLK